MHCQARGSEAEMADWNADPRQIGFGLAAVAALGGAIGTWLGPSGWSADAVYGGTAGVALAVGVVAVRIQRPEIRPSRRRRDLWLQVWWAVGGAALLVSTF